MKAIVLKELGGAFVLDDIAKPEPGEGEVLIRIAAAALNHRDLWIKQGKYFLKEYPCVLGSDGAGIVESVGAGVSEELTGNKVVINPALHWGPRRHGHGKDFQILGMPTQGTFAEYICVPAENVYPIPIGLSFEKAATLPLAGLTAYRAMFYRGGLKRGEKILITGIGGGVASFLLSFGVKTGALTYVSSSSQEKIQQAVSLGAMNGVLYTAENWTDLLLEMEPEGFDLVIDSAGGPEFLQLLKLLRTGGKIVNFGGTAGKIPEMVPAQLFWKQASILGTTMGSPIDFEQMLSFVTEYIVTPIVDRVFPMEEVQAAFDHMQNQSQFGKIVLRIADI
ncbi:MAG: zinc-binding dehydrogenase [Bacteroidales bacterium]|nr:zinc-binding dehydrogenase [Bacteroidales bacterium]